jgi:hypothetical protein
MQYVQQNGQLSLKTSLPYLEKQTNAFIDFITL